MWSKISTWSPGDCTTDRNNSQTEFGERYLEALRAYQEVFFAEEEKRIRPASQETLAWAQELAGRLALPDLLEELPHFSSLKGFLRKDETV